MGYGASPLFPINEAWSNTAGIEGWEGPSGGWALTIGDLARFMIALDGSEYFVDPSLLALMRAPHTDLTAFIDHYGMGMFLGQGTDRSADYHHGGDTAGHHAHWAWRDDYLGHDIGIGLMCNRDDLDSSTLYEAMTWQSGEQSEDTLLWLAINQNPDPPSQIIYAAVAPQEVEHVDFEMNAEKAWLVGGQHLVLPFGLADLDLFLTVDGFDSRVGNRPTFVFGQGRVDASGVPTIPNPVVLESVEYRNPTFMTAPTAMSFGSREGSVYVQDLILEGSFGEGGRSIEAVSLSGRLDTREAGALGYDAFGADACEDVKLAGGECTPCPDGERRCLEFRYENLQGIPVPEPGFAGALMLGIASLRVFARRTQYR